MTIPAEYQSEAKTIGNSAILHPIYSFTVNLDRLRNEKFGPNTNQSNVSVLHPDMYDSSADRGRTNAAQHQANFTSLIPGFLLGENVIIHDNGTITAYGQKAVYLKKTYADVENPLLTLTNSAPYTSA